MLYDGIFFINHALNVKQLSVYTNEERFNQTVETLKSIDNHCPNTIKFIFDSSPEEPKTEYIKELSNQNTLFLYFGNHPEVRRISLMGYRSVAETISFILFLDWFKDQSYKAKRIYKLSGRYRLNDNFIVDDDRYKDHFVFSKSHASWMESDWQEKANVNRLYPLRCWHMDYNLLDTFRKSLPLILNDCASIPIDVEHSYYKNLHTYKTIELDKIGVCGNIAPSGDYIDE